MDQKTIEAVKVAIVDYLVNRDDQITGTIAESGCSFFTVSSDTVQMREIEENVVSFEGRMNFEAQESGIGLFSSFRCYVSGTAQWSRSALWTINSTTEVSDVLPIHNDEDYD